jgi:hypothetical protein
VAGYQRYVGPFRSSSLPPPFAHPDRTLSVNLLLPLAAHVPAGATSDFLPDAAGRFLYNATAFVHHILAAAPGADVATAPAYLASAHSGLLVAVAPPIHARHDGVLSLFRELKSQLYIASLRADEPIDLGDLCSKTLAQEGVIQAMLDDEVNWKRNIAYLRLSVRPRNL